MINVSDEEFQTLINQALEELPGEHAKNIENVAILFEDEPSPEERVNLKLDNHHTLLGLYQGTPLSQRQGRTTTLPDRITLYKIPLCMKVDTIVALKENIKHTLWHEIAHYYGLNHDQIKGLE